MRNSTLENITIVNNTNPVKTGGGAFIEYSENITISNMTVSKNYALNGGGLAVRFRFHFNIFFIKNF